MSMNFLSSFLCKSFSLWVQVYISLCAYVQSVNRCILIVNCLCCSLLVVIHYMFCSSTAQEMKFSIKDFFSKYDQICSFMRIWSHLLENYLMENFIYRAVINSVVCQKIFLRYSEFQNVYIQTFGLVALLRPI